MTMRSRSETLTFAQVIGIDSAYHKLKVIDSSGQPIGTEVYVGIQGASDALRINQQELPGLGTWGLVAMPYGDDRNAVWICSLAVGPINAVNNNQTTPDPYFRYLSHYSGFFETLDQNGNKSIYFPDGTSIVVGSTTSLPTIYRNSVSGTTKTPIQTNPSDRITTPPSPFNVGLMHSSGTSVKIDPSGNTSLLLASGASFSFTNQSGFGITMDASGNIIIKGNTVMLQTNSGNSVLLDASGDITETGTTINLDGNVDVSGNISGGTGSGGGTAAFHGAVTSTSNISDSVGSMAGMRTIYDGHDHNDPQGGVTGVPNQPM